MVACGGRDGVRGVRWRTDAGGNIERSAQCRGMGRQGLPQVPYAHAALLQPLNSDMAPRRDECTTPRRPGTGQHPAGHMGGGNDSITRTLHNGNRVEPEQPSHARR